MSATLTMNSSQAAQFGFTSNPCPAGLNTPENTAKLKIATKQWSQLVAWSWSKGLAFEQNQEQAQAESRLKKFFIKIMQNQAMCRMAGLNYGNKEAIALAKRASETIKNLFAGMNHKIEEIRDLNLTISDVLKKLTGEDFLFAKDHDFRSLFTFSVTVDEFEGGLYDDEANPGHYVAQVTYPPCPTFSDATVTEEQLDGWMHADAEGNYLPPSAYIPLSAS